ncbi:unnamed protein product [Cylicostephanus goldi]|uniref:Uncharacterized protein n=1 Tax=Cylicostephanus goldi TaxID=71465 RepID=A0A3P6RPG2_CYLGO|nr:unnamed protein product [Cylicostephanus goldi]
MEVPEQDKVQQLAGLPELLIKVLTDEKYNKEKHIRLDAAALLLTTFCHVLYSPDVYLKLAKASLYLINDEDEDVRAVYKSAFKVIVSSALSSELVDDIFVEQFCKSYPLDCDQTMAEASNIFVVLAAKHSRCPRLAEQSLHQLFVRALRYPGSISIFDDCKLTVQQLAAQEFKEGRDVRRFFARRKRVS